MDSSEARRISFCVTCKNRLWQLRQTFPDNLTAVLADGNAEIVLVNYNSADELDDWIRQFHSHIRTGVLRYVHERTDPFFHCSKAKNLAHLAATGDYVVNLDGDNYIGDTITTWRALWTERHDTVIHGFCVPPGEKPDGSNGTYGRIGLPRESFVALGGYDEQMHPVGQQDIDLVDRARRHGLAVVRRTQLGVAAIRNTIEDKIRYCGTSLTWREMWQLNIDQSRENLRLGRLTVNPDRVPVKVLLNFTEEIEL